MVQINCRPPGTFSFLTFPPFIPFCELLLLSALQLPNSIESFKNFYFLEEKMQHDELIWSNIGNKVKKEEFNAFYFMVFRISARLKRLPGLREPPSSAEMNII
jgi:hypothetical protein